MTRPLDSREAILRGARSAFEAGHGEIEMNDVAKRAGVSVGLAYHYFGSKAGLVSALVTDFYDRYDAVVNRRYDEEIPWAARERMRLADAVNFLFSDPLTPVMLGTLSASAAVAATERERRDAIIELATVNIRSGQERGAIPADIDPHLAAAFVNGGLRQALATAIAHLDEVDPEAFIEQAWGFVARTLALD